MERTQLKQWLDRPRLGAIVAVLLVILFLAWLLLRGDDEERQEAGSGTPATAASIERLRKFARSVDHPIYWAGERPGQRYELTETARGDVYIRYLPPGVQVGVPRPDYTTVGTYPGRRAFRTIEAGARRPGARTFRLPRGGLALVNRRSSRSVYFSYPGSDYLVEVYSPSPRRARALVTSGQVGPVL